MFSMALQFKLLNLVSSCVNSTHVGIGIVHLRFNKVRWGSMDGYVSCFQVRKKMAELEGALALESNSTQS